MACAPRPRPGSFLLVLIASLILGAGCGDGESEPPGGNVGGTPFRDRSLGGESDVEDEITPPSKTAAEAAIEAEPLPAPADPTNLAAAAASASPTDPEEPDPEPSATPTPAPVPSPAPTPGAGGTLNRLCFSPKADCLNLLLSYLQAETQGIDIAIYHLYDSRISQILIRKHRAGVRVRVLADRHAYTIKASHEREMNSLASNGVPVRTNRFRGIIHHKLTILHGLGLVEQGSMNYTSIASRKVTGANGRREWNEEVAFFTTNPRVLARYRERFDRAWANTGTGQKADLPFTANMTLPTYDETEAAKPVTCYENPDPSPKPLPDDRLLSVCFAGDQQCNKNVVGPLITAETQRLDVIAFRITVGSVVDPILAKARAGLPVRVIFEPAQYNHPSYPSMTRFLDDLYAVGRETGKVQIKATAHQGFMHMKSVITSHAATWGSGNYTTTSSKEIRGCQNLYYQTEDMVIAKDQVLVGGMRARFDEMWNSADFAAWAPPGATPSPTPTPTPTTYSVEPVTPVDGQTVAGVIRWEARGTTPATTGIDRIQFWVDGVWMNSDSTSPYCYASACTASFDTTKLVSGPHTLRNKLVAKDGTQVNRFFTITVQNGTPTPAPTPTPTPGPTALSVSFVSPASNATVSGDVPVEVGTTGPVARVDVYVNGARTATVSAAPFRWVWSTRSYANGTYALYVQAVAADGAKKSATRYATVRN